MADALADYALLEHVGTGGLGELYRARDTRLGRTAAVKVVRPELVPTASAQQSFIAAVGALRGLSHPNIASLYDVGEEGGRVFLALEWVNGAPLRSLVAGQPLNVRRAVAFGAELANALADAHARDQLHGDITADTILITPTEHAKLLDFGLADWTRGGELRRRARSGQPEGHEAVRRAAAYVAPEQVGTGAPTTTAELFSLGVVIYEMLTGRLPFTGAAVDLVLQEAAGAKAVPPSQINSGVPEELDRIVARAMFPDPAKRCQSAAALAAELRSVGAILEIREGDREPPTAIRRARRPAGRSTRRRRWPAIVAAVVVVAAAGMVWGSCQLDWWPSARASYGDTVDSPRISVNRS